jgi:hypothetical protein
VAACDLPIPVRVDHRFWPLDFMMIRRFRLAHTPSLSDPIWITGFRSDGREQVEDNTHRLGFPVCRRRRDVGQGTDVAGVLVVFESDEVVDGVQEVEATSTA